MVFKDKIMLNKFLKKLPYADRIDRIVWQYGQPLTKKPSNPRSAVSDLFIWRKGNGWKTYFELTDIASLFGDAAGETTVQVIIFDQSGRSINNSFFEAPRYSRRRIDISELASSCRDNIGTFCVLHSKTPNVILCLGSNLAERGYVSYGFPGNPLTSFVHGNLDAVSLNSSGSLEFLAGTSFLKREFRLQHLLEKGKTYDLVVVNASTKMQSVQYDLHNISSQINYSREGVRLSYSNFGSTYRCSRVRLHPGGCNIFHVDPCEEQRNLVGVVIKSHLVMLRPIVFQIEGRQINAFHG